VVCKRFKTRPMESTDFHRFQYSLESNFEAEGREFESLRALKSVPILVYVVSTESSFTASCSPIDAHRCMKPSVSDIAGVANKLLPVNRNSSWDPKQSTEFIDRHQLQFTSAAENGVLRSPSRCSGRYDGGARCAHRALASHGNRYCSNSP
jgi:hypothetical protein